MKKKCLWFDPRLGGIRFSLFDLVAQKFNCRVFYCSKFNVFINELNGNNWDYDWDLVITEIRGESITQRSLEYGIYAIKRIRNGEFGGCQRHVPIIVLTSVVDTCIQEKAIKAGRGEDGIEFEFALFEMPVLPENLSAAISSFFQNEPA